MLLDDDTYLLKNSGKWELSEDGTLSIKGAGEVSSDDWSVTEGKFVYSWDAYAERIQNIVLSDGIDLIGQHAFSNSTVLKSVSIPDSVTDIKNNAFRNCSGLKDIYFSGTKAQWCEIRFYTDTWKNVSAAVHCTDGDVPIGSPDSTSETT